MSTATDLISQLSALQHADSFFPSGGVSFSQGLETLYTDREVKDADTLAVFVEGQLLHRWRPFDAPALVLAHQSSADLNALVEIDAAFEAMSLATELREGSRRAGGALLSVHEKLGTTQASAYRQRIADKTAFGHLPIAQGLVWGYCGVSVNDARAISAHLLCTGLVSAALRLGFIGHLDAQRVLLRVRPVLIDLLDDTWPELNSVEDLFDFSAYTPATEIAVMRHETHDARLFAN
ncbi:MAG: urease accessory protein UreF [Betaproteobacteria bacterium]